MITPGNQHIFDKALEWTRTPEGLGALQPLQMPPLETEIQAAMMDAQHKLIKLEADKAQHEVWASSDKGRPPMKQMELNDQIKVLRQRLKIWLADMRKAEQTPDDSIEPNAQIWAWHSARLHFAHLLNDMALCFESLGRVLRKSTSQYKMARVQKDKEDFGFHAVIRQDPNTFGRIMTEALNDIHVAAEEGREHRPFQSNQLFTCADRLNVFPAMTLEELFSDCGGQPAGESVLDCAEQLINHIPRLQQVRNSLRRSGPHKCMGSFDPIVITLVAHM